MKKKGKILFLCFVVFLLSGCSLDYTLTISKDSVKEETFLYSDSSNEYNNVKYRGTTLKNVFKSLDSYKQPVFINDDLEINVDDVNVSDDVVIYDTEYINKNNKTGAKFSYKFSPFEYENAYIPNTQVNDFYYSNNSSGVSLKLSYTSIFKSYSLLDNINVYIVVDDDYEVIDNNASTQKGNTYIWNFTRDNYLYKEVLIQLEEKKETINDNLTNDNNTSDNTNNNTSEKKSSKNSMSKTTIIIIASIILLIGFSIWLILSEKKHNINRI